MLFFLLLLLTLSPTISHTLLYVVVINLVVFISFVRLRSSPTHTYRYISTSTKYPYLAGRDRDVHLGEIGTDMYLGPDTY